jgi:hypothetical protein
LIYVHSLSQCKLSDLEIPLTRFTVGKLLVAQTSVYALYAPSSLSGAQAVRLYHASRSVAVDLPNPHSHYALFIQNILCLPCLEEQGSKRKLENCPSCERWYCPIDSTSCIGHPVTTPLVSRSCSIEQFPHAMTFCSRSPRIHPPKRGSYYGCKLPGWRHCAGRSCWSRYDMVCPECTSGGTTCVCQNVWACDVCAKHDSRIFIRCPRYDRLFCNSCHYIDLCSQYLRATLCFDCAEEASDTDDGVVEMFATLAGTCRNCGRSECNRCAPIQASWESCDEYTI